MHRVAVTTLFALNGAAFSSWYARLPAIQDDLELGTGLVGLALLGAPAGLLAAQPLAGAVIARRGSRAVLLLSPLLLASVVLPALAVDFATLLLAVTVVGACNGVLDIAINAQGVAVERASGTRLFTSLHAAFSFGAIAGALLAGAAAAADVEPLPHLAAAAVLAALVGASLLPWVMDDAEHVDPAGTRFARPSRRLLALGAIAFCALLAEGAIFDWSSIYLDEEIGAAAGVAPLGLAAFNLTMGFGRLAGDAVAARLGSARLARGGLLVAAAGMGLALLAGSPVGALGGFAVMGIGLSNAFPLTLRATDAAPVATGPALAAVSTVGYAGFLLGPPVIGLLGELTGLRAALALVCVLCVVAALLATPRALPE